MTEAASLSLVVALCVAATVVMVRSHRRSDSLGSLVALMMFVAAGVPASIYGTLSG